MFLSHEKNGPETIYVKIALKNISKNVLDNLLLIQAFLGCDTASPLYGIEKNEDDQNF